MFVPRIPIGAATLRKVAAAVRVAAILRNYRAPAPQPQPHPEPPQPRQP